MGEVLVAEVRSDSHPRSGQKGRASANFSLGEVPEGTRELVWRTEPDSAPIRFTVMVDVRANYDQPVLSNLVSGSRSAVPRERESLSRRGLYIANPSGAPESGFVVRVYAIVP
ncbi:DeoR family transcriptional regulator [Nocardia blacklockiae]|uniref:DeoR family transcriptional regulator n=1 Tax=Nocardia blacklockiae TaxID=480036 RepID=UPI00189444F6|nr:DeoR family transcriptional regulator [Nocardia blacklockiae]MBF6173957.1 DeoR family transcriptional regulator [Nocardia blacklockiae]